MESTHNSEFSLADVEGSKEFQKMLSDLKALWGKPIVVKGPNGELVTDERLMRYDRHSRAVIRRGRAFRKYLDQTQFIRNISRILLALYQMEVGDRPKDVVEYICCRIHRTIPTIQQEMTLTAERQNLLDYIAALEKNNEEMKSCEKNGEGFRECQKQMQPPLEEIVIVADAVPVTEAIDVANTDPKNEIISEQPKPTKAVKAKQKLEKLGKSQEKQEKVNTEKEKRKQVKMNVPSK